MFNCETQNKAVNEILKYSLDGGQRIILVVNVIVSSSQWLNYFKIEKILLVQVLRIVGTQA